MTDRRQPRIVVQLPTDLDQWRGEWLVGPSIIARYLPAAFKNGIDIDGVDGAAQLLYDIPAIRVEYVRHEEPALNTGFWRGVGVTHNNFVIESFVDELAAAAKQDPAAFRRALLRKSPRAMAVLDIATQASGWGKPLPAGLALWPVRACRAGVERSRAG